MALEFQRRRPILSSGPDLPGGICGKPPHPQIAEILNQQRSDFSALLRRISQCSGVLASVPLEGNPDSKIPFWRNGGFENLDAAALVGMLVSHAPSRYMEIGSGNSTKFARHAIQHARLSTSIVSLDPNPRGVGALCDKIVRKRLEDCDLSLFDQLEAGDILFLDGSHRVFTNSDVTVFFLELMPRLRPGVIVHVHDILLPSGLSRCRSGTNECTPSSIFYWPQ